MGLLPIVPILLLPFILIFFVIVFPIWVVGLAVLGLILVLIRGLDWLLQKAGSTAMSGAVAGMRRAFHWVLTFGGFAEKLKKPAPAKGPTA
ncbi:MAG: hypothetical protein ABI205_06800 [Gemmatimonadaceae bacterium]